MRLDYTAFVTGLLVGITATVALAMLIDFQSMRSGICLAEESSTECVRNWFHVLAVAAGGVAVFSVFWQVRTSDRHHREAMDLQTLSIRALFERIQMTQRITKLHAITAQTRVRKALREDKGWPTPLELSRLVPNPDVVSENALAVADYDSGAIKRAADIASEDIHIVRTLLFTEPSPNGRITLRSKTSRDMLEAIDTMLTTTLRFFDTFERRLLSILHRGG